MVVTSAGFSLTRISYWTMAVSNFPAAASLSACWAVLTRSNATGPPQKGMSRVIDHEREGALPQVYAVKSLAMDRAGAPVVQRGQVHRRAVSLVRGEAEAGEQTV